MASAMIEVAKAIVTELNADPVTNFGHSFTAERSYGEWNRKLEDVGALKVDVVDAGYVSSEVWDRGDGVTPNMRHVVAVQIAIRQRFSPTSQKMLVADIDPLKTLCEEIHDFFVFNELTGFTQATWVPTAGDKPIEVSGAVEDMKEHHQFSGVVRLHFEVVDV